MAYRQSLTGVCFVGVQTLKKNEDEAFATLPIPLYKRWMVFAASIQNNNVTLNNRCTELQKELLKEGIQSSILKGQGIAALYGDLALFRQCGDIDVYVDCDRRKAINYAKKVGQKEIDWDYKHLHLNIFNDVEIEMHYRIEVLDNLIKNKALQKWFSRKDTQRMIFATKTSFVSPSTEFNLFYILLHNYRHFLYEGLGLRQLQDYYYVLTHSTEEERLRSKKVIENYGMTRFAEATMWVLQKVFAFEPIDSFFSANQQEGEYFLTEIIIGGNFGQYDKRLEKSNLLNTESWKLKDMQKRMHHSVHMLGHYTSEVIWNPAFAIWHKCWKATAKIKDMIQSQIWNNL